MTWWQLVAIGDQTLVATSGPPLGKAAFVGVFVLVLLWLLIMPRRLLDPSQVRPPAWRNARFWAIAVTVVQIVVYLRWG
jgi:hypothetical protein